MRLGVVCCLCVAAALAAQTAGARPAAVPAGCAKVRPHAGRSSGDWEAVFGSSKGRAKAVTLLRRVRRKGFRCAVIERERRRYEVAVVGLHSVDAATRVVVRARREGLGSHVDQS
ncbi:MAG TPA: SPOR domain-containing protein [Gaiellaceae bacterium]